MKTRYANPEHTLVDVTLSPGESVGTFSVPEDAPAARSFPIFIDPPNPDGDALLALIKDGTAPLPESTTPGGVSLPPPGSAFSVIYKADIWRRASDEEAEMLEALIQSQPIRKRRLFDDATLIRTDDELFATLQAAVTQVVGKTRAAALLAPSN